MKKEKNQTLSTEQILSSQKMFTIRIIENNSQQLPDSLSFDHGNYPKIRSQNDLYQYSLYQQEFDQQGKSFSSLNNGFIARGDSEIQPIDPQMQRQIHPEEQYLYQDQFHDEIKEQKQEDHNLNNKKSKKEIKQKSKLLGFNQHHLIFKKNVNMPKAVGRYLMKYYQSIGKTIFQKNQQLYEILNQQLQSLYLWSKKNKKNTFRLKHLAQFFNDSTKTIQQCKLNRTMMREILIKYLRQQIIPNQQVKDKKEYLVGLKVYALRCANAKLATRMQMR